MGLAEANDSTAVAAFERARELGADDAAFHNNYALMLDTAGATTSEAEFQARSRRHRRRRRTSIVATTRAPAARGKNDAARRRLSAGERRGGLWSDTVYLARARDGAQAVRRAIAALEPFARMWSPGESESRPKIDRMPPTLDEALDVLGMCWREEATTRRRGLSPTGRRAEPPGRVPPQ
jgi:hypothetical protein